MRCRIAGGSSNVATSASSQADDNNWHFTTMVRSGDNLYLYFDGVLEGSTTGVNNLDVDNSNDLYIGRGGSAYPQIGVSSASLYNVAKSADEVYAIYQKGITYDESSLSGLVGYWRMGDDTSASYPTIADSSSNSNDGTITNGASDDIQQQMVAGWDMGAFSTDSYPTIQDVTDNDNDGTMTNMASSDLVYSSVLPDQSFLVGNSSPYNFIDLDGSNEYIDCGDGTSLDITGNITLSAWVNSDVVDTLSFIAGRDDGTNRNYYLTIGSDNLFTWNVRGLSDTQVRSTATISAGSWFYVVGVYDGSSIKLYLNGTEENSDSSTGSIDNDDVSFTIGAREAGADRFVNGKIGQVAVWSKALSSTEVSAIYDLTRHGNLLDSYSDNLVGYWAMGALDASTGLSDVGDSTIYDRSGQSNHGTATNTESADLKSSPNAQPEGYAKGDTNRSTTTP
jgi:hypothetical protein